MRKARHAFLLLPALACAVAVLFSPIGAYSTQEPTAQSVRSSRLVPDADGVLWFERGDDGHSAGILSGKLSCEYPYFIVFVGTTPEYETQAIAHAKMLAQWFEDHPQAPSQVRVVAFRSKKATSFMYHINGLPYLSDKFAPRGFMGPQESYKALEDTVLTYRARMIILARNRTEGQSR